MKSIILAAALALAGLSAAAPPAYHQHARSYPAHYAKDTYEPASTVIPYYSKPGKYEKRIVGTVLPLLPRTYETVVPYHKDDAPSYKPKPLPKYKQYKKKYPTTYGKRQEIPTAVPAVVPSTSEIAPEVPAVPAVPVVGRQEIPAVVPSTSDIVPEVTAVPAVPVVSRQDIPVVPETADVADLPSTDSLTSTVPSTDSVVPETGSIA